MATALKALAANIAARRARRAAAFIAVQELRRQPATAVGQAMVRWLHAAYGWEVMKAGSPRPQYWLLRRDKQTMLALAIDGSRRATWRDVDELLAAGTTQKADMMAIGAPAGVPDREEITGMQHELVHLWGPLELERLYVEIEYELDGVSP